VRSTRIIAGAAVVVLVALVASAVTLASTDSGQPKVSVADVAVGAGPPTTATGVLTYSSTSGISISADWAFNFTESAAELTATASLSIVTATVEARVADDSFYLHVPQFASLVGAPWVSTGELGGPTRLDALATQLRHPDLARLHPTRRVTTHTSAGTTTTMSFGLVHLPSTAGLPISLPRTATVTATVVTGTQGQLLAAGARLVSPSQTDVLAVSVTSYNAPVEIAGPASGDVVVLTAKKERAIFGTNAQGIAHALRGLRHVLRGEP
jgi:hypothetical protein